MHSKKVQYEVNNGEEKFEAAIYMFQRRHPEKHHGDFIIVKLERKLTDILRKNALPGRLPRA